MVGLTLAQIAEWRRALQEEGDGEFLDPTLAQVVAPKLVDEVERLHEELASARRQLAAEEAALLEKRLTDAATDGGGYPSCENAEGARPASADAMLPHSSRLLRIDGDARVAGLRLRNSEEAAAIEHLVQQIRTPGGITSRPPRGRRRAARALERRSHS